MNPAQTSWTGLVLQSWDVMKGAPGGDVVHVHDVLGRAAATHVALGVHGARRLPWVFCSAGAG